MRLSPRIQFVAFSLAVAALGLGELTLGPYAHWTLWIRGPVATAISAIWLWTFIAGPMWRHHRQRHRAAVVQDARVPVTPYEPLLHTEAVARAYGTALGAAAFGLNPDTRAAGLFLVIFLVQAFLATRVTIRSVRRIQRAGPFFNSQVVRLVEFEPPDWSDVWPYAVLAGGLALLFGVGTTGLLAVAYCAPALARFLISQTATRRRERSGVELFVWADYEDGSPVVQVSAHPRGEPLNEKAASAPF